MQKFYVSFILSGVFFGAFHVQASSHKDAQGCLGHNYVSGFYYTLSSSDSLNSIISNPDDLTYSQIVAIAKNRPRSFAIDLQDKKRIGSMGLVGTIISNDAQPKSRMRSLSSESIE
jgi:hypothetical protein